MPQVVLTMQFLWCTSCWSMRRMVCSRSSTSNGFVYKLHSWVELIVQMVRNRMVGDNIRANFHQWYSIQFSVLFKPYRASADDMLEYWDCCHRYTSISWNYLTEKLKIIPDNSSPKLVFSTFSVQTSILFLANLYDISF